MTARVPAGPRTDRAARGSLPGAGHRYVRVEPPGSVPSAPRLHSPATAIPMNKKLLPLPLLLLTPWVDAQDDETYRLSTGDPFLDLSGGVSVGSHSFAPRRHDDWTSGRPDGHAPIGVMGDHLHSEGEWMVSVRVMRMHMDGMQNNGNDLSPADVFAQGFAVTPTEMDMDMIMLGGMYAPSDNLTLMAMIPYLSFSMDHVTGMGGSFTTESEGLGDVVLSGMYGVADHAGQRVHLNLGLSLPTGSVDERDDTPAMANAKLPYPMQLGTGTFDLLPGITYLGQDGDWSWGAQQQFRFHLGENDEGYKQGNRFEVTGWVARRLGNVSVSGRLRHAHWENFHGSDPDLNPAMVPTADPDLRGGDRLDALFGLNAYLQDGPLAGHRFAFEFGVPVYQDLDGPQLETDWILTLGWQLAG